MPLLFSCKKNNSNPPGPPIINPEGGGNGGGTGGNEITPQVEQVNVHTNTGSVVYANGRMQVEVDLSYTLKPGVELKSAQLVDFSTNQPIAASTGWTVSKTPNSFDKLIPSNRGDLHRVPYANTVVSHYLSADRSSLSKVLFVCAKIETVRNNIPASYSTCAADGHSIAQLSSIEPLHLTATDFKLTKEKSLRRTSTEFVDLYSIVKNTPELQDLTFTIEDDMHPTPRAGFFLSATNSAIHDYQITDHNSTFLSSYFFEINHPKTIKLLPPVSDTSSTVSYDFALTEPLKDAVARIIHVTLGRKTYLANELRCTYVNTTSVDKCRQAENSSVTEITVADRDTAMSKEVLTKALLLTDNFGTRHTINLRNDTAETAPEIF